MIGRFSVLFVILAAMAGITMPALASPAQAATAGIIQGQPYHICEREDTSQCLSSTGLNLAVETTNDDRTDYCYDQEGSNAGNPIYQIYVCNEPTHCLKGDSDFIVRTVSCNLGDMQQLWEYHSNNTYANIGLTEHNNRSIWLGTFGTGEGTTVQCNWPTTGFDLTWYFYAD
jgi:hypothetical protein